MSASELGLGATAAGRMDVTTAAFPMLPLPWPMSSLETTVGRRTAPGGLVRRGLPAGASHRRGRPWTGTGPGRRRRSASVDGAGRVPWRVDGLSSECFEFLPGPLFFNGRDHPVAVATPSPTVVLQR